MPQVTGPIKTTSPLDTYSIGDANRQSLGFHSVNSLLERNNIPLARRRGNYDALVADVAPKPFFVSVRIGSVVTLYWLKNEPGTDTTLDSDWEAFVAAPTESFQGFFIPSSTTLVDGTGTKGFYYIASAAGTHNFGAGNITFAIYDKVIYDGALWQKVGGTTAVADWNTMTNKPAVFPPEAHTHDVVDITNLDATLLNKVNYSDVHNQVNNSAVEIPTSQAVVDYAYSKPEIDSRLSDLVTYGITYSWANQTQQNAQTGMQTDELGLRQDTQVVNKWSGTQWDFFFKVNTAGAALTETITSKVNVGNIVIGQVLAQGLLYTDFVKKLVVKVTVPTYTQPTGSIALTGATTQVEVGSVITPTITPTKNNGDAGALYNYSLFRDDEQLVNASGLGPWDDNDISVFTTPIVYTSTMSFSAGVVKYDDATPPNVAPGQILDTTITTNTITITGKRNLFYDTSKASTTSSDIRALVNKVLNPSNGLTFNIPILAGATSVEFAYPATLEDVFKVLDNGTNLDIKGAFTQTLVNVEGANAFTAISYKVYRFQPVVPFSQDGSYTITI